VKTVSESARGENDLLFRSPFGFAQGRLRLRNLLLSWFKSRFLAALGMTPLENVISKHVASI